MKEIFGYLEKYDLSSRSTIRLGPRVDAYFPHTEDALLELLEELSSSGREYVICGGLSNLLPNEDPNRYVYVFLDRLNGFVYEGNAITLGAGCRLGASLLRAAREGFYLLPSLVGIPGTVGGAVFSNAGAFGEEIGDRVIRARFYDPQKRVILPLNAAQMKLSYRHSILKEQPLVLLDVTLSEDFSLCERSFRTRVAEVKARRGRTQPHEPSLGCVFKAHEGVSVGYYLDRLGMKGRSLEGIVVSELHAGFLVNRGGSIGAVKRLIADLKREVSKVYGFVPETEIQIL